TLAADENNDFGHLHFSGPATGTSTATVDLNGYLLIAGSQLNNLVVNDTLTAGAAASDHGQLDLNGNLWTLSADTTGVNTYNSDVSSVGILNVSGHTFQLGGNDDTGMV